MENTVELRSDLRKSFIINNRIAQRVYDNAKLWGQKTYRKAMTEYKKVRSQATSYINKAKKMAQKYYNTMVKSAQKAYLKSSEIVMDIYNAGLNKMHKRAYFHAEKYYKMAGRQYNKMVKQYKPVAMKMYTKYTKMAKSQYIQMKKDVLPYYRALKKAYNDIKMGVSVQKAMKPVLRQIVFVSREYQRQAIKSLSKAKSMFCKRDPKLCKHLNEASRIHKKLFNKYYERAAEIVAISKARFDRAVRMLSRYTNQPIFGDYNVAALMFDNSVLTFDKTYFQMGEGSEDCSYLLAHDFAENQFTVKKVCDLFNSFIHCVKHYTPCSSFQFSKEFYYLSLENLTNSSLKYSGFQIKYSSCDNNFNQVGFLKILHWQKFSTLTIHFQHNNTLCKSI